MDKKFVLRTFVVIIGLSLTACGNSGGGGGGVGYHGPPMTPPPTPAQKTAKQNDDADGDDDATTSPNQPAKIGPATPKKGDGDDQDYGPNGPKGAKKIGKTKTEDDGNLPPEIPSASADEPAQSPLRVTRRQAARRQIQNVIQHQQLSPWFPPDIEKTPAESWLVNVLRPLMLNFAHEGGAESAPARITLALGYIDGYNKTPLVYEGKDYGLHAAVDPFLRADVDLLLQTPCVGELQLCGFSVTHVDEVAATYEKTSRGGQRQQVVVLSGAMTPSGVENLMTGPEQAARSARASGAFIRSLADSDLVVYVGHSREGGGPDFAPPRLLASGAVNYAAYQKNPVGLNALLRAIRARGRETRAIAIMSCDSTGHFQTSVERAAGQGMEVASIKGAVRAEDLLAGGLSAAELFLRQGNLNGLTSFNGGNQILAQAIRYKPASLSTRIR